MCCLKDENRHDSYSQLQEWAYLFGLAVSSYSMRSFRQTMFDTFSRTVISEPSQTRHANFSSSRYLRSHVPPMNNA